MWFVYAWLALAAVNALAVFGLLWLDAYKRDLVTLLNILLCSAIAGLAIPIFPIVFFPIALLNKIFNQLR